MEHEFNNNYTMHEEGFPFPEKRSHHSKNYTRLLRRQMLYIWMFLVREDIWDEACEFLEEHMDDPSPFELFPLEPWTYTG